MCVGGGVLVVVCVHALVLTPAPAVCSHSLAFVHGQCVSQEEEAQRKRAADAEAARKRAEVRRATVWLGCSAPSSCLCCRQVRTCVAASSAPVCALVCLFGAQEQARRAAEAEAARKRVEVSESVWWAVVRDGRERLLHPQRGAHAIALGTFGARAPALSRTHTRIISHARGLGREHMHARLPTRVDHTHAELCHAYDPRTHPHSAQ